MKPVEKKKKPIRCDFCGKSEKAVKEIVAGSKANICNECVETCSRIIEMARVKKLVWDALVELNQKQAAQRS